LTEREIAALTSESGWEHVDSVASTDVERSVLQLTSELLATSDVSDTLFRQVHEALGSEATVEVLMVIGRYAGLALMLNALDVDLDETARMSFPGR
jgi:alkylhydroperoxidase family enzyme